MKEAAYQLAAIIVALTVLIGGLMAVQSAVLSARGDHAMNLQRIAWKSYQHQIDMKNLPRPEWHRAF